MRPATALTRELRDSVAEAEGLENQGADIASTGDRPRLIYQTPV